MKVELEHRTGESSLKPVGALDAAGARVFRLHAEDLEVRDGLTVVVDLADVPFLDSSGLGVLIALAKRTRRANAQLRLENLGEQPRRLIHLTQLDRFFDVDPTVA